MLSAQNPMLSAQNPMLSANSDVGPPMSTDRYLRILLILSSSLSESCLKAFSQKISTEQGRDRRMDQY